MIATAKRPHLRHEVVCAGNVARRMRNWSRVTAMNDVTFYCLLSEGLCACIYMFTANED